MPSSARVETASTSLTSPAPNGPMAAPATSSPTTGPTRNRMNSPAKTR